MNETLTTEGRRAAIQAAVQSATEANKKGQSTSTAITWKGREVVLPVAVVDLDLVLLNPHSHRIGAQLQSLSTAPQQVVAEDPFGVEAQAVIAKVLEDTAGFERIKNALANDGQLDHGVLTDAGVLINANTRAVALRALREKYIKVVVLPSDATVKEITDLELRLQMEQVVKQPYTFTSQLLFYEDLINKGWTTVEVGRAVRTDLTDSRADRRKAVDLVEQELRLLGLIRDVIGASGKALTFVYFDDKRQALIEIDQDYQKTKNTYPDEAARVKDAQLAGLIAGVDYRKLREIDSGLLDGYLDSAMREHATLAPHVEALLAPAVSASTVTPEGVDLLDDGEEPVMPAGPTLSGMYMLLAKNSQADTVALPVTGGSPVEQPRKAVAAGLHGTLLTAIENKQRDSRRLGDLSAPVVHLREAVRSLDKATTAYADAHDRPGFDRADFDVARGEWQRAAAQFLHLLGEPPSA